MKELLTREEVNDLYIASGSAHQELTEAIASSIGTEPGPMKTKIHPNGELYSRYLESVRGKNVFVVQSHVRGEETNVNDAVMQQCLMIDAARSSSAREITAVAPYMSYMRQDRKTKGREPIGTRVILDQLANAGADRIVTVDMHSPQAQGIFRGPFDHLTAQPILRNAMAEEVANYDKDECVIVSPDAGAAKLSEQHRISLGIGMFVMTKLRDQSSGQAVDREGKFTDADGRVCLLFDDMVDTAGTLVSASEALINSGARAVYVAATHGVLSEPALQRLKDAPIEKILITDTFRTDEAKEALGDRLRVVSVAPMIGQAILEIIRHGSVSELFDDQNNR